MEESNTYERYQRQILLKGFGIEAQVSLLQAKVLVIGAGGLGCPCLQYLVAAGVGTIGIADGDIVEITNLHRQPLYNNADIGKIKSLIAAKRLSEQNPEIKIKTYEKRIDNSNALSIFSDYDIIIDGTDNFSSRYLINDACQILDKPLVYAAVSTYEGQLSVFNVEGKHGKFQYRDLFPEPPGADEIPNCAEAGVLGVLPGLMGIMQAAEAIKIITGKGNILSGKLLTYDFLSQQFLELQLKKGNGDLLQPLTKESFENFDYPQYCGSGNTAREIDLDIFSRMLNDPTVEIIDVRNPDELPEAPFGHINVPLSEWETEVPLIDKNIIIVFCQSGQRSNIAANRLSSIHGKSKEVYSLKGGILKWMQYHANQPV